MGRSLSCEMLKIFSVINSLTWLMVVMMLMVMGEGARNTRIVRTKQGSMQGMVILPSSPGLAAVEAYLGVPYATPPTGSLRFMPPVTPQAWDRGSVRRMTEFGSVCPQIIPDLSQEEVALRYMSVGRMNYLKKLIPFLARNQAEDCLYLNIYTPEMKNSYGGLGRSVKMPVLLFIHGESYEWNSGNPYDGSVLASYGQVVVVTINYRLGILGFLRTSMEDNKSIGNYGLLDIIAALHWLQENISQFGGDPSSVTMVGHGTGATLTELLLLSPVSSGGKLFHRAVLMSGSSLAKSALIKSPTEVTRQVATETNCSLTRLADCLRRLDVTTLLNVKIKHQTYTSPLGPYVDGTIIPDHPDELMKNYVAKCDLMFGVTQSESYFSFPAAYLTYGLSSVDQRDILRSLLAAEFGLYGQDREQVMQNVFNEYRDFTQTREDKLVNLQVLLDIFSDARVVAPLIRSARLHSLDQRKAAYVYTFQHTTINGYFAKEKQFGSVPGEDLPYMLGMPLVGGTYHLVHNYTEKEKVLSEHMMSFWVNFAKTGNPGSRSDPARYSPPLSWPPYDNRQRKHMVLSLEPQVSSHYRAHKMALWNQMLTSILQTSNMTKATTPRHEIFQPTVPTRQEETLVPSSHRGEEEGGLFNTNNLPVSLIVMVGLLLLAINLVACAGVYYQKMRLKRREHNLERKIKRMSDAGFMVEDSSHQSGVVVDSNIQLGDDGASQGKTSSRDSINKRAHFQLRKSNSVKETYNQGSAPGSSEQVVLKSALKKPGRSAEALSSPKSLVYTDDTFSEASYPRQSKSIPNIRDSLSSMGDCTVDQRTQGLGGHRQQMAGLRDRDRPLSKSFNTVLESEDRAGPDVLLFYQPGEGVGEEEGSGEAEKKTGSLTRAAAFLKGKAVFGRRDSDRPPSPIIEMVPCVTSSAPNTYQFPARSAPSSHPRPGPCDSLYGIRGAGRQGDPIYGTMMSGQHPGLAHRPPGQYGITYPIYTHGGPVGGHTRPTIYPPLPLTGSTPSHPTQQYVSMVGPPGHPRIPHLTTPQGPFPLRSPLGPNGTLPRHPNLDPTRPLHPPGLQRQNSTDQPCLYSPLTRPVMGRVPSLDQHMVRPPDLLRQSSQEAPQAPHSVLPPQSTPSPPSNVPLGPYLQQEDSEDSEECSECSAVAREADELTTTTNTTTTTTTPVLRKVGEKTPPGTLKRDRPKSSCKSWYSQYSQAFLSKTIDTPDLELPPLGDEEEGLGIGDRESQ